MHAKRHKRFKAGDVVYTIEKKRPFDLREGDPPELPYDDNAEERVDHSKLAPCATALGKTDRTDLLFRSKDIANIYMQKKRYSRSPLLFQRQKRNWVKHLESLANKLPNEALVVDLFGRSGYVCIPSWQHAQTSEWSGMTMTTSSTTSATFSEERQRMLCLAFSFSTIV